MNKIFSIILILCLALIIGFYLGLKNRDIQVVVNPNIDPQAYSLSSTEVFNIEAMPWYISRSSAIAAYLLMFLVIIWGTGMTTGVTYKLANPVNAWSIHKYMSISMGILIFIHAFSLLFDKFINFGLKEIFIPFWADFKPLYLSLGIIGFYIIITTILSSLFLRLKSPKLWRFIHYLTYPLFVISLIHGLYIGTDSKLAIMQGIYWVTGTIFIIALIYRFIIFKLKK